MNQFDDLRFLFNSRFKREKTKGREMKRVFQWRRYLEWKDLTSEEKLSAKRFLFVPIFAYLIIGIFNQNFLLIVFLLIGYLLYKKLERGKIVKK
tara:strand:+ start:14381 stop:14662 length:282 start_codon:yes stop_codon:yes gene_type:complete